MSFLLVVPFTLRIMLTLGVIVILWWRIGKKIVWVLSVIPFLLKRVFILVLQMIEIPVALLHKKLGNVFYAIDNGVVAIEEYISSFFEKWYKYWRWNYEFSWRRTLIIYFLCVIYIIAPSIISIENNVLKKGEEWYLIAETAILEKMNVPTEADAAQEVVIVKEEAAIDNKSEIIQIKLVVAGLNSSLLVRDIPNMEAGIALDRLYNEDTVIWNGEMVFAEAENKKIEAWVKVKTQNNAEGWSRLRYLYPVDYEGVTYYVNEQKKK